MNCNFQTFKFVFEQRMELLRIKTIIYYYIFYNTIDMERFLDLLNHNITLFQI